MKSDSSIMHRLTISLDHKQLWFVIASFGQHCLDYLADDTHTISPRLPADPTQMVSGERGSQGFPHDMTTFRPIGPFNVNAPPELLEFSLLYLALLLTTTKTIRPDDWADYLPKPGDQRKGLISEQGV